MWFFCYNIMFSHVYLKEIEEVFETPIIQQTAFWSEVKGRLGVKSIAVNIRIRKSDFYPEAGPFEYIMADMLVLLQQVGHQHCFAYVPYGPEIDPGMEQRGIFLEQISEQMRSFLPTNCIMIRYDLSWESFWAKEPDSFLEDGTWIGPPSVSNQEFRFNFGSEFWNLKKAGSNLLPSNTIFVDLEKDSRTLLENMKPKTRYNIGLSLRRGVDVRMAGLEHLPVWYGLYAETAARNNFYLHNIDYFKVMLEARANDTQSPADVHLLIAENEHRPLAAMFLVISENRATYLYGASSGEHRQYMATYALQWKAMELAKKYQCKEYDMFGIAPDANPNHPMHGLYRFKTGFGGVQFHSMGCWDYPLIEETYQQYASAEMRQQGYHLS